jgi:CelD/BcsL family acetyltransferase involved in cellulose biosynthesis
VFPRLSVASFDTLAAVADELRLPWRGQWARYSYAFDTTCGRDEFLARLDGKYRRELGRRRRRLFRELPCELVREEGLDVDDAMTRFEAFMDIEDSGWKGENETSIRRRAGYESYFRELVRSASRGGQLVWYTLQTNRRPIAMYLALRTHDTVWLPKIGYDERFSEHAPGLVMKHDVLLHCIDDPEIRRVDNLSAAPWVRPWQPAIVPFRSMTLFGSGVRSQLVYRALAAKHRARRFLGRADVGPGPCDRPYL